MKRLIKKSMDSNEGNPEYDLKEDYNGEATEVPREDPYLGRYVEITNRRSKYYGHHAWVDDKFFTDRYKLFIEPLRYDDVPEGKDYIINFVGTYQAPKWFSVIE
ncbi:MAG: hypothetical protein K0R18_190 [Bacillales bacterium]|jgi:hypothetical protein|nr:hypothetical protein [Bacillales bacterium]